MSRGYCYSSLQIFYISLGAVQWGQDDCIQCDEGKVINNNKNMEFYILCRTGSEMHFIYRTNIPILLFTITTISPISTLSPTMTSLLASRRKTSNWKLWFDLNKTPTRPIFLISLSLKANLIDRDYLIETFDLSCSRDQFKRQISQMFLMWFDKNRK